MRKTLRSTVCFASPQITTRKGCRLQQTGLHVETERLQLKTQLLMADISKAWNSLTAEDTASPSFTASSWLAA
uniref:Uncharacterized protein n=1 Tax=Salix viminalis TaxID=40686 RepID=A0A6N2LQA7_SALVM